MCLLAVALAAVPTAAQNIIVVDPGGGGDYTTIQAALEDTAAGDVILVRDGTYNESVHINTEGVSLVSENHLGARLTGALTIDASGVSVQGFAIDATGAGTPPYAIAMRGSRIRVLTAGPMTVSGAPDVLGIDAVGKDGRIEIAGDGGVSGRLGDGSTVSLSGALNVTARDQGSQAAGVTLAVGARSSVTAGDAVTVRGGGAIAPESKGVRGVDVHAGGGSTISLGGPVDVAARDEGSWALGVRLVSSGAGSFTVGGVSVEAGARAEGAILELEEGTVTVDGPITVVARGEGSHAEGLSILFTSFRPGAVGRATVGGGISVSAGYSALGTYIQLGDDSAATFSGPVTATTSEAGSSAVGLLVYDAGAGVTLSINGPVSAAAGGSGSEVVALELHEVRERATVEVAGSLTATASETGSSAVALEILYVGEEMHLTASGPITATAGALAVGAEFPLSKGSTVVLSGPVRVTAHDEGQRSRAGGVLVWDHGPDAVLRVEGEVAVNGGWAFGVLADALGENSRVSVEGPVTVTGRDRDAEAYGLLHRAPSLGEAAPGLVISVAGPLTVSSGALAVGVELAAGDGSAVQATGPMRVVAREAGSQAFGLRLAMGSGSEVVATEVLTVEGGAVATGLSYSGSGGATVRLGGIMSATAREAGGAAYGLDMESTAGATVTLTGDIVATGATATGVSVKAPVLTLENPGTIAARGRSGQSHGLAVHATETIQITNAGRIDAGPGEIAVQITGDPNVTLHNSGTIAGHVSLGGGHVELMLTEHAAVHGNLDLGGAAVPGAKKQVTIHAGARIDGTLTAAGASSSLVLKPSPDGVERSTLLERTYFFEETVVQGGRWIVGYLEADRVEVENGRLTLDGELWALDKLSLAGGRIDGNGSIVGHLENLGGVVDPGSSFGVIHIAGDLFGGDYTQGPDAVLKIDIKSAVDPKPGEDHDQLVVTGTARFADGTTIQIVPHPGVYRTGVRYRIVDGTAIFNPDKLQVVFGQRGLLFLNGRLETGSVAVVLETRPFETIAASGNQTAVAAALTAAVDAPGTSLDHLYGWLFTLEADQEAAARRALDSLSGEVYTALPTAAARRLEGVVAGVGRGLAGSAPGSAGRGAWWAAAQGGREHIRGDAQLGTAGSTFQWTGVTAGADLLQGASSHAGVLAGYHTETLEMPDRGSVLHGTGLQLGLYGRWPLGQVSLTGVAAISRTRSEGRRRLAFDGGETALASFDTTDTVMALEGRFEGFAAGGVAVVPVASVGRYTTQRGLFSETGAAGAGLTVHPYSGAWVRVRLGVELLPAKAAEGGLTWGGRLAWVQDVSGAERAIEAHFNGAPGESFTVNGTPAARRGFGVELAVNGRSTARSSWSLEYQGRFRPDGDSHGLLGRLVVEF